MRRRQILSSLPAAAALTLVGCGGGGGGGSTASAASGGTPTGSTGVVETTTPQTGTTGSTGTPATTTGGTTTASGSGYAFGSRKTPYAAGILPSQSNAAMDAMLTAHYDRWKAARVVAADSIVAGGYAVKFSDATFLCVSEGMGYGMLLAVLFAGHDPNAQQLFDGLLAVVRTRYAYGNATYDALGKYLMDWRLYANGASGGEGWNAVDGDLDVAMALLMADRQWGSGGKWNYLQEAKNTIAAIKAICMRSDGTTKGLRTADVSRTSDYMVGHFRAFAKATGDSFWNTAIDRSYALATLMQTTFSSAGLMPDFIVGTDTATPIPSPGFRGDGNANEDRYWWNACRNPWRFSSDYLLSGDARWKTVTARMIDFFRSSSGGDPMNIGTGYYLNGTMATGGQSPAYHGPICAGACIDAQYRPFLDAMWTWNAKNLITGYYDGELQLLSLVVASGNWWSTA
ncbi:glycosyl hydrolase family 8 [Ramlibacter sp. PS4R-6]|uniref:glycosyl hydrolase family 8 n=1 Tax=Ramlibacter sp. PS4R-6 TaxID=3133438 RepID=UPI0030A2E3C9